MSDANFASLSSTLLARKGGAKPAMRPQSGIVGPVDGKEAAANLEDLGWNDMGDGASDETDAREAGRGWSRCRRTSCRYRLKRRRKPMHPTRCALR